MIYNARVLANFLVCAFFIKMSTTHPTYPPEGYELKKVQWGYNQEREKLVPVPKDEEKEKTFSFPFWFFRTDGRGSCNCGKCVECQLTKMKPGMMDNSYLEGLSSPNYPNAFYGVYGGSEISPVLNSAYLHPLQAPGYELMTSLPYYNNYYLM